MDEEILITTDDKFIIFTGNEGLWDYDIPWSKLDTPDKVDQWTYHLSEKRWFSDSVRRRFHQEVIKHFKKK